MRTNRVAIVGATGAVGLEMIRTLEQREFPLQQLDLLASARGAGRTLRFRGRDVAVQPLADYSFRGVDLALFSAGAVVSREHAPRAAEAGTIVIDNSSAFRLDPAVPLVVPECNRAALQDHHRIISNPNCSTILMVMALTPLHRAAGIERVVVATYQAASGAGQRAMHELRDGIRARLAGEPFAPSALPHDLAFNVFPHVDTFQADGYTREEDKMLHETRRIMGLPQLAVEATCVRVPVERCHSLAVAVALRKPLTPAQARAALSAFPGVVVRDEPEHAVMPQPIEATGRDPVLVGRIRASRVFEPGLALWVVGDQLRKGAALNAVQIAETL